MPNCPNCGEPHYDGASFCTACGVSLSGGDAAGGEQPANQSNATGEPQQHGSQPRGGQPNQQQSGQPNQQQGGQPNQQQGGQPNQYQGGQQNQQPAGQPAQPQQGPQHQQGHQAQGGQQYQGGQQPQGGQQYQQGGYPTGGPQTTQSGGQSRRKFLKYGAGAAVLGGAGLLAYTTLTGGGPVGTARSFVNALDSGNVERANSLIHDDSPTPQVPTFTASTLEQVDLSVESAELISRTDTSADVRMDISASAGFLGTGPSSIDVSLRTQNGEWRIWTFD